MPRTRAQQAGQALSRRRAAPRRQQAVGQEIRDIRERLRQAPRPLVDALRKTLHASGGGVRNAVLTRCLTLTRRAVESVSPDVLAEAASASSDKAAMLRILEAPEMAMPEPDVTALETARVRGVEARDQLLAAEGGPWSVERVAKYLGLTRQAVDKRRKANKLIGLTVGRHGYLYPAWQFGARGTLPGLEDVLESLRSHDPWAQVIFMLSANDRLDGATPLQALRETRVDDVKMAASLYGEHGAA